MHTTHGHLHHATPADTRSQIMETPKHLSSTFLPTPTTMTLTPNPSYGHDHLMQQAPAQYPADTPCNTHILQPYDTNEHASLTPSASLRETKEMPNDGTHK